MDVLLLLLEALEPVYWAGHEIHERLSRSEGEEPDESMEADGPGEDAPPSRGEKSGGS